MTIMNTSRRVVIQNEDTSEFEHNSSEDDKSKDHTTRVNDPQESDSSNGNNSENEQYSNINEAWADSVSKILKTNKPKGKKTLVLSKAKKLNTVKIRQSKSAGFEVEDNDGKVIRETISLETKLVQELEEPPRKKKRELPNLRVKPNVLEKDRERTLAKIATKGVVQLFNAVRGHQKDVKVKLKEAGSLEVKRDKVLKNIDKRAFLDVLMGEKSQNVNEGSNSSKTQTREVHRPTWNVLRDDFMMGAKLKDWDKELEDEQEIEQDIVHEIE